MSPITPVNWLRLVTLGIIWGASFMFISIALEGVPPRLVVAARLGLGAVLLLGIAHMRGVGLPSISGPKARLIWLSALGMGLFSNAVPFFLLSWGQQHVASGFAGVCMSVVPLLVLPLSHALVPGEQMNLRRLVGFVIGTAGVIVLIGPAAFATTGAEFELVARIACVTAACGYAIGSIITRLCPEVDMISLSAAALGIAALIFVPYALAVEPIPTDVPTASLFAMLYLGVLPTAAAQILLVQIIRSAGPVFMSLVNYQVPVWSLGFGIIFLGEQLPPNIYWALLLILSGLALSQLGALRRLFANRASRRASGGRTP